MLQELDVLFEPCRTHWSDHSQTDRWSLQVIYGCHGNRVATCALVGELQGGMEALGTPPSVAGPAMGEKAGQSASHLAPVNMSLTAELRFATAKKVKWKLYVA